MKKWLTVLMFSLILLLHLPAESTAQCSICTRTAQQLGEKPAKGLNAGILYIAFIPFAIAGYAGYRWWHNNKEN